MSNDVYSVPSSNLEQPEVIQQQFYVVSITKFFTLLVVTVGLYQIYWFYRNWHQYKLAHNAKMLPPLRGVFAIFFIHSLFRKIDEVLRVKQAAYVWNPDLRAGLYMVMAVSGYISDHLARRKIGLPVTEFLDLALLPAVAWLLYGAQRAINLAMDDPEGRSNSRFTAANILWIGVGGILWMLMLVGAMTIIFPDYFATE